VWIKYVVAAAGFLLVVVIPFVSWLMELPPDNPNDD